MKHLLLVSLLALFPACAAMQQQYVDAYCNTEGSFQLGYNDSTAGRPMDSSFATMCAVDQDQIRRSYRDGFDKGLAQKPKEVHVIQQPVIVPVPVPSPNQNDGWECKESYGEKKCGYSCKAEYGQVKCAQHRHNNCEAAYGTIKCGRNCRTEYGEIVCDRYE